MTSILDMPLSEAMEVIKEWVEEVHDGKLELDNPLDCPVQQWIQYNDGGCGKDMLPSIETCTICGSYICPDCGNHKCSPMSRVTGYIQTVDGWNASKKQELADRARTPISNFG